MADQATLNGGPRVRIGAPLVDGVLSNIADFGSDLATLAELQAQLGMIDLKDAANRATAPAGIIAGGGVLLLGSLPVLLLGVAELLVSVFHLHRAWALLLTAGVTIALASAAIALALPYAKASVETFRRSREELTRNVAWVKTVLAQSGRYVPRPRG